MSSSDKSGLHAAVGTIIGAVVGSLISFGGIHYVTQSSIKQDEIKAQKSSYVKVMTESAEYRIILNDIKRAKEQNDKTMYVEEVDKLKSQIPIVYAAVLECVLLLDDDEDDAVWSVINGLYLAETPDNMEDADVESIRQGMNAGWHAMEGLLTQFQEKYQGPSPERSTNPPPSSEPNPTLLPNGEEKP